jgi:uncharacterized membrane protein YbhN (UPF0104 family)
MAVSVAAAPSPTDVESPPLGSLSLRRVLVMVGATGVMLASLVLLAPVVADLPSGLHRLENGEGRWLVLAFVFEALSFLGHAVLFRAVGLDERGRIGMRASVEITLAGHVATRLLASAGAGGVALTAWTMRKAGMSRSTVGSRMTTFIVVLYSVYMVALILGGAGLALGLLPGGGSPAMTIAPALLGAGVIAGALSTMWIRPGEGRVRRALAPVGEGVREALRMARSLNPSILGALMWWGFDIAVLWACFNAFGAAPAFAVIVVAYFVGTLANTLPLPGGVGGVEGGMVGALVAFGVDPALALVAVLAYRGFAFWLPIIPGAIAFATLRRTVAKWEAEDEAVADDTMEPWKASATSSTIRISSDASRRWPSRCRRPSHSLGLTTPSSSLST